MRGGRALGMCKTGEVAEHIHQVLVQTDVVFFRSIRQRTMQRLRQTQRYPAAEINGDVGNLGQALALFLELELPGFSGHALGGVDLPPHIRPG